MTRLFKDWAQGDPYLVVVVGAARCFLEGPHLEFHRFEHLNRTWHDYIPHLGLDASERLAEELDLGYLPDAWQWLYDTLSALRGIRGTPSVGVSRLHTLLAITCSEAEHGVPRGSE